MMIPTVIRSALGWAKSKPLLTLALVVFAVLGTKLTLAERHVARLEREADDLTLTILNDRAAADTTITFYQDGVLMHQRLAQQYSLERDSVDRALGVRTRALSRLRAAVPRVDTIIIGDTIVVDSADVRTFGFQQRILPYTISGRVTTPPPPVGGTVRLRIDLDSALITARVVCVPTPERLDAAALLLEGPSWLSFTIEAVAQDPEVCNPDLGMPRGERSAYGPFMTTLLGTAAGAMAGWILDDSPLRGAGIGLGTTILFQLAF
jgi:hypothetical protein